MNSYWKESMAMRRGGEERRVFTQGTIFLVAIFLAAVAGSSYSQTMKRNRGETYYTTLSSNTEGRGNTWLCIAASGHVWDEAPARLDSLGVKTSGFWVSNTRAFPEIRLQSGITEFFMATVESRPITWAGKMPGFVSVSGKLTWPNNQNLRFFGFGIDLKYQYNTTSGPPTLGGYVGFMPEGYVAKGSVVEGRFIGEADLISKISRLPLHALVNIGMRRPIGEFSDHQQFLFDAGAVYTGYDYDFFATYSLEAFDNVLRPKDLTNPDGTKRILVWFWENPMYLTLGGNVRYANGVKLSIAAPLLLSFNVGSKMTRADLEALNRERRDRFPYEVAQGIKNPFDPWFVKWKIAGSLSFPIRYKLTSAEMMRNYLLLKNRKQRHRLDIDDRLKNGGQGTTGEPPDMIDDAEKRMREIQKRKEEMQKRE